MLAVHVGGACSQPQRPCLTKRCAWCRLKQSATHRRPALLLWQKLLGHLFPLPKLEEQVAVVLHILHRDHELEVEK